MPLIDICRRAGLRAPAVQQRDWLFDKRLPVIRGLLRMQSAGLLRVYVDAGRLHLQLQGEEHQRAESWEAAERLLAAWTERKPPA